MTVGAVTSTTVTATVQVAVLFDESVAVIVTVFRPSVSVEPAAGDCVRVTAQRSVAVARPVRSARVAVQLEPALTV